MPEKNFFNKKKKSGNFLLKKYFIKIQGDFMGRRDDKGRQF